ncbi:MAG TPA: hypothetical protein VFR80_08125 [Pyrinomonadaceae bacterium]|nr:hypothetical protein [Pyrinomonadaceae bacterium]
MIKLIQKVMSGGLFAAIIVTAAVVGHAQSKPLVPVNTNFSYWDHHWIMWIPKHPLYEAVEVLSVDGATDPNERLIRVFFTEKKTANCI